MAVALDVVLVLEEVEMVGLDGVDVDPEGDGGGAKMLALAMERRERMRSSGYVVPECSLEDSFET